MRDPARRAQQLQELRCSLEMAQIQADELEEYRIAALIATVLDALQTCRSQVEFD